MRRVLMSDYVNKEDMANMMINQVPEMTTMTQTVKHETLHADVSMKFLSFCQASPCWLIVIVVMTTQINCIRIWKEIQS